MFMTPSLGLVSWRPRHAKGKEKYYGWTTLLSRSGFTLFYGIMSHSNWKEKWQLCSNWKKNGKDTVTIKRIIIMWKWKNVIIPLHCQKKMGKKRSVEVCCLYSPHQCHRSWLSSAKSAYTVISRSTRASPVIPAVRWLVTKSLRQLPRFIRRPYNEYNWLYSSVGDIVQFCMPSRWQSLMT